MLTIKIVTPERPLFEGESSSISVMTETGEVTILPGHVPLASLLRAGEVRIDNQVFAISTGLLEVKTGNQVMILADTAERSDELILEEIEKAKQLAEERIKKAKESGTDHADAMMMLEREMARLRIARKGKYRDVGKQ